MRMKTIMVTALVCATSFAALATTGFAAPATYAACTVENCALGYAHEHNGSYYAAHHAEDGHTHNQIHSYNGNGTGTGRHHNGGGRHR